MSEQTWFLLTLGAIASMGLMLPVWLLARRVNNVGVLDVGWSLVFTMIAVVYFFFGVGDPARKLLIAGMVAIWSLRLAIHLLVRLVKSHPKEDGRYARLREQYPRHTWLMFFSLFELEAVVLVILSVPLAIAASNNAVGIQPIEWVGVGLWLVAVLGETVADWQLLRFRGNPANAGRTCRSGLWRYSRHPNYFFEWLIWVAYFVFALGSPAGWIAVLCPLLMLFFLFHVSGIPITEAEAIRSRGDDYRAYQRTTSAFVPWFPKRS